MIKRTDGNGFEICFTPQQVFAFSLLSHDKNPLHLDEDYSRRTPFGRPVVYGMCSVLANLGTWAAGRTFRLRDIRGRFLRPLFVGVPYQIKIEENSDRIEIRTYKGNQLQSWIKFSCCSSASEEQEITVSSHDFRPRSEAKDWGDKADSFAIFPEIFFYEPNWDAVMNLERDFGLKISQIPADQLSALLWSSYFIGMEVPGKQALFAEFVFNFRPVTSREKSVRLYGMNGDFDRQYNHVTISGEGTQISSFKISAFSRPKPVTYDLEAIRKNLRVSPEMKGKTVLITGACRGFGAVLSKAFALQGAKLALNYRFSENEARSLRDELSQLTDDVILAQGDVGHLADCKRIEKEVFSRFTKLDFLICNASPHLEMNNFLAQDPGEFMATLQSFVAVTSQILYSLLPRLEPGATIIYVSTIATQQPVTQFSHYVAGKIAVEGLVRVLAKEFESLRFVIVRPPRMLTDLTNLPYDLAGPASAVDVAVRMMEVLDVEGKSGSAFEINL